jgi:2-keto-4-pentenoate hydratase/2-oxohepta-3-ene-1,7-dioic acid hydratase in catechol pathway
VGPCLATADEIPDPSKLTIRSFVNEEKMQESGTDDMIFDVPTLISFLSGSTTLLPGTLILTGTPSGVGEARNPKRYLVPGDEVTVEIDGLGILTNPVVEEVFEDEEAKS